MKKQIEKIMQISNDFKSFQEACFFIVSEVEKLTSGNWNKKEKIINWIEKEYKTILIY